jgi:hypothetical protein
VGYYIPSPAAFGTHFIGHYVGVKIGLYCVDMRIFLTLPKLELQDFGHRTPNQSLHRLLNCGSFIISNVFTSLFPVGLSYTDPVNN